MLLCCSEFNYDIDFMCCSVDHPRKPGSGMQARMQLWAEGGSYSQKGASTFIKIGVAYITIQKGGSM
jgi:glutamine synthetase